MKRIINILFLLPFLGVAQTPTSGQNYIKTSVYREPATSIDDNKAQVNVTYFDGLGRPIQKIAGKASASGNDVVTHIEYDGYGRQPKDYLPYPSNTNDLSFVGAKAGTSLYYGTDSDIEHTSNPFSRNFFEASPLSRIQKTGAPGNPWAVDTIANNDNTIKYAYLTNTADDKVMKRSVLAVWNANSNIYTHSYISSGNYAAGELYKTITQDENKTGTIYTGNGLNTSPAIVALKYNTTEEYKNKEGQIVLKRTFNAKNVGGVITPEELNTYYLYDQFGNLSYVTSPISNGMASSTDRNNYGYQYRYDHRNRLAEKKLPGKQWDLMVYDPLDRIIITGPAQNPFDGIQAGWLYTYYDVFGRVALTGWAPQQTGDINSSKRNALQQAATIYNVPRGTKLVDGITIGYNPATLPSGFKLLTVNYYDDYAFLEGITTLPSEVEGQTVKSNVKSLPTGSWVRVLAGAANISGNLSYTLYDNKSRPIRSYTKNYLGGYVMTENKLGFDGKAQYTTTRHRRISPESYIYIKEDFTYTAQDRLLSHTHTINSDAPELMGLNEYTELGQLKSKKLGGTDITGAAPLQKVDYTYNVRGWLKEINKADNLLGTGQPQDLFAFAINYNEAITNTITGAVTPLYNGNIAETTWRTAGDNIQRRYGYTYDKLNRLNDAWYQIPQSSVPVRESYNEHLQYDKNGNIMALQRNGGLDSDTTTIEIDNLVYTYTGNQLLKVKDNSPSNQGFSDVDQLNTDDYQYDGYGNMTTDLNKGITQITYNHLNLPIKIVFNNNETTKIEYLYDAVGAKVKKTVTNGTSVRVTDYLSGFQYVNEILEFFPTSEGYVKHTPSGNPLVPATFNYVYNYTDHLGNVRLSYTVDPQDNALKILEENHYYPFGLKHKGYSGDQNIIVSQPEGIAIVPRPTVHDPIINNYKYNGKELQDEMGLGWYDFELRQYDPAIGRMLSIDPVTHHSQSPYVAFNNNPVVFVDPDGADAIDPVKESVTMITSTVDKSNVTHITQTTTNTTTTTNDDGSVHVSYSTSSITNTVDAEGNVSNGKTVTQTSGSITRDSEGNISSTAGATTTRNAKSGDASSALGEWTNTVSEYNQSHEKGVYNVDMINKTADYTTKAGKAGVAILGGFGALNSLFKKINPNAKSAIGIVGSYTSAEGLMGAAGEALKNIIGKNNNYAILYGVQHIQNGSMIKAMKTPSGNSSAERKRVGPTSWQGLWKWLTEW